MAILVLFASCSERVALSDLDAMGLRYKVKSMDESFYTAYNSFDSIILQTKIYQRKYEFHHDSRYRSIEKFFYCNREPYDSTTVTRQDSAHKHFPFAYKEPEYRFVNYRYISDSLTTLDFFDRQGILKNYINRRYAKKRLISEEKYSGSGTLISKSGFRYDSRNRVTNITIFYQNRYEETCFAYAAGEKYETGEEFNCRYLFDINGRISRRKKYRGITLLSETSFFYNSSGETVMRREIDSDGAVMKTVYEYTYDSNNNWILCVEYNCTGNIFVRERKITYYN
ncbi:MAG: hypothetical protein LBH60_04040 [Prevotellaceae bacterium]|jgi:hypothetical protein|nr:hypothetical protein [Prevotellaceae bacterium]